MTELIVRRVPFDFTDTPFMWNPQNPEFAVLANALSFEAVGFERFVCRSMQQAREFVRDPSLATEIKEFCAQEMVHAHAHLAHARSIVAQYPALQGALDETTAEFDRHWEAHGLEYRLAYSAIAEATSLPLFRVVLEHREKVLGGGDPSVVSLLLWHFCEEIEHRSSALQVYNHVVGKAWHRMQVFPRVGQHLADNLARIAARFAEHVPGIAGLDINRATARFPLRARISMVVRLLTAQFPGYDPTDHPIPEYCEQWARRYAAGEDMSRISPT